MSRQNRQSRKTWQIPCPMDHQITFVALAPCHSTSHARASRTCGPLCRSPFIENLALMSFEFFAVALQQAGSAEFDGHDRFAVVRRSCLLVGHFQKEQKSDLLGVSHVGKPIIAHRKRPLANKRPFFVKDR